MEDPVDSIRRSNAALPTGRVTAAKPARPVKREHEHGDDFIFEDKIDVAPQAHLSNAPDQIDISIEMILALVAEELPVEAITALQSFAPLGDLKDATENCTRVLAKGQDFITWQKNKTLTEALAYEAV